MTVQDIKNRLSEFNAGYWCPEEWEPFIVELDKQLARWDPEYEVDQVKEKFGGLRYYFTASPNTSSETFKIMLDLVSAAEQKVWEFEKINRKERVFKNGRWIDE